MKKLEHPVTDADSPQPDPPATDDVGEVGEVGEAGEVGER